MQAAGSEAERTQAGLTAGQGEGRAADLSESRRIRSRLHTLGMCNPTFTRLGPNISSRRSYHTLGHPLGRYGWNGDGRVGRRGPFRRLRAHRSNLLHIV